MLIDNKGNAKIADLGLSVDFSVTAKKLHKAATTLLYRSPEQLFGLKSGYGFESDVWSLGCILAELLQCEPLFCKARNYKQYITLLVDRFGRGFEGWEEALQHSDFPGTVLSASAASSPDFLKEKVKGLDAKTLDLFSKLLTVRPERRISVGEVLEHAYFEGCQGVVELVY